MRILILNPPSPESSYINRDQMGGMGQKIDFGKDIKARFISLLKTKFIHLPVMQLVYAATLLSQHHHVLVIDATNDDKRLRQILPKIRKFQPDFTFMAVSSSGVIYERDVVAKAIKEVAKTKIITIGDTIPAVPALLKEPFDIAVIGEIEPVVGRIVADEPLEKIKGIIHRRGGRIVVNMRNNLLEGKELDAIPFPRWELFNYKRFTYYPLLLKEPVAPVLASRGCPFACHYCSYSQNMGIKWRARSAENVVAEVENDMRKYKFRGIAFRDPLFSFSAERVKGICRLLKKKNLNIVWACETRPELLTKEIIDTMYSAGCRAINIGIESIHANELKNVGRQPIDRERLNDVIHYAEKRGIRITCFFILGLPGSTRKSIKEIIEFSIKLNPSHAEYKVATPYPGTKLYSKAKKSSWIVFESFEKLGGYSSAMQTSDELSPEFLEKASSDAFKGFYLRKDYILRELFRRNLVPKLFMMGKTVWRIIAR